MERNETVRPWCKGGNTGYGGKKASTTIYKKTLQTLIKDMGRNKG